MHLRRPNMNIWHDKMEIRENTHLKSIITENDTRIRYLQTQNGIKQHKIHTQSNNNKHWLKWYFAILFGPQSIVQKVCHILTDFYIQKHTESRNILFWRRQSDCYYHGCRCIVRTSTTQFSRVTWKFILCTKCSFFVYSHRWSLHPLSTGVLVGFQFIFLLLQLSLSLISFWAHVECYKHFLHTITGFNGRLDLKFKCHFFIMYYLESIVYCSCQIYISASLKKFRFSQICD